MSKRRDAQRYRKSYSYFRPAPRVEAPGVDQSYVDNAIWSIDWKQSVRAASTPGLNVSLTGGPYTIDGVTLSDGDRVLLKDQTDSSENGIYVYSASTLLLVRDYDALQGTLTSGAACFVEKGTINTETMWVLTTHDPIIVGTTLLHWMEFFPFGNHSIFTETSPVYAKTTSSVSFDSSFRNTDQIGSDVFFFVSGSLDGSGKAVFGGDVRVSGSLALGTGSAYIRVQDHGDVVLTPHKEYIYAGNDVFFYVSGSPGDANKTAFGGDVKVSGSLAALAGLSGSLTTLSDGTPYLVNGPGISIVTQSNGSIFISTNSNAVADVVRMGAYPVEMPGMGRVEFTVPSGENYKHAAGITTISVYLNGVRQSEGAGKDFLATETSPGSGIYNRITFSNAPTELDIIQFDYIKM